ncbi:hypothetical protein ASF43_15125 [Pseudorhodoferax sp. Leaf267]|nr:hypothetical protein ASF43_15125 [Pseudorhodoferax sp. Leaf267]
MPDQLRISQGWVRCGQCDEVFDAAQDLRDQAAAQGRPMPQEVQEAQEAQPPRPAPAEAPLFGPPEDATTPAPARAPEGTDPPAPTLVDVAPQWLQSAPPEIPVTDPAASLDVGFAEYQQAQVQADDPVLAPLLRPSASDGPAGAPAPDDAPPGALGGDRLFVALAPGAGARLEAAAATAVDAMPLPQRPASDAAPSLAAQAARPAGPVPVATHPGATAHAEVSFLRDAPEMAPVRVAATPRRGLWLGAAALLLLVLVLQLAVHTRDRLASAAPALRPVLRVMCLPLGCTLQPLRRIDAIVIDGSAFVALGEQGYRLSLTLRNRAPHAVALPALVLSLTDIQEQAVVRRVLLPEELGAPPAELAAHGEWSTSVDLQLADNAGRARVVGYRLDSFYP